MFPSQKINISSTKSRWVNGKLELIFIPLIFVACLSLVNDSTEALGYQEEK
jgi:hypothetical protein